MSLAGVVIAWKCQNISTDTLNLMNTLFYTLYITI